MTARGSRADDVLSANGREKLLWQARSHLKSQVILGAMVIVMAMGVAVSGASAAAGVSQPALTLTSLATPTNFTPGDEAIKYNYDVRVANLGAAATDGTDVTITDTLPPGLGVKSLSLVLRTPAAGAGKVHDFGPPAEGVCKVEKPGASDVVTCTLSSSIPEAATIDPGEERRLVIYVAPTGVSDGETLTNVANVSGGGSPPAATSAKNEASSRPADGGVSLWRASSTEASGEPDAQAGSHPYQMSFGFAVHTKPAPPGNIGHFVPAGGDVKDIRVALPAGLSGGAALRAPRCTGQQFATLVSAPPAAGTFDQNECPNDTAVGVVLVQQIEGAAGIAPLPLYNLEPEPGMPAQFGTQFFGIPFFIDTEVLPDQGYKVVAVLRNLSQVKRLTAASVIIWGNPADARHDPLRGTCVNENAESYPITIPGCEPLRASEAQEQPLLRLPTNCDSPLDFEFAFDSWTPPSEPHSALVTGPAPSGCNQLDFKPTLEARPTTNVTDSPSGLTTHLHIPQPELPKALGEADLRKTVVTLPTGMTLNPSSANGLASCSSAQIGYAGKTEGADRFSNEPARCPAAARIGTVEVDTPLIDHPLKGGVFVASPHDNPFNSLLAIYIAVDDQQSGVVVKLAGHVEADPTTGQLVTTFDDTPQTPFEDLKLNFYGGPGAALRTPPTCGSYHTDSLMTPWSAPESGPPVQSTDTYAITAAAGGGTCPTSESGLPNVLSFSAGTVTPTAGAYSPLVARLDREDGSQTISGLNVILPPGLLGKLAGVSKCTETSIMQAEARTGDGQGTIELASPSCPSSSEIGTVTVGAGAGPHPYYTTGRAYLAGPYKGAPFDLVVITPAVAGPYDLGTVVVRTPLYINPTTAQVHPVTDPLPTILHGIPLDIRSIALNLNRSNFILNPTNCEPLAINATVTSTQGTQAPVSSRFQVGGCARLPFKPGFSAKTTANGNFHGASLDVKIAQKSGEAAIHKVNTQLPIALPSRLVTIQKACTERQFASNPAGCPSGSAVGTATAISPILNEPMTGPAYLVSHGGAAFPDLDIVLQGEGITIDVVGNTDIKKGITYSRFETVPDAPISSFELKLPGGPGALLAATKNLCAATKTVTVAKKVTKRIHGRIKHVTLKVRKGVPEPLLMPTTITGQNGAVSQQNVKIAVTGCKKAKAKKKRKSHKGKRR